MWIIAQIFVAFSGKLNFKIESIVYLCAWNFSKKYLRFQYYIMSHTKIWPWKKLWKHSITMIKSLCKIGKVLQMFKVWLLWKCLDIIHLEKTKNSEVNGNGILLPKLFWPTVRKNCSSDPIKKKFWYLRLKAENFQNFEITRTICSNSERSEQVLVADCFCNFFLKVSQI